MKVIGNGWDTYLAAEYDKEYFKTLEKTVRAEYETAAVYPPARLIFQSLELCDYRDLKVVVLGQDPYHGERQANGIAFAVNDGIALPPSLVNIYKEIETEFGCKMPKNGNLLNWASQGVLLLNASLTVRAASPGSHAGLGWQTFTDAVIKACGARTEPLVFLLWGAHAAKKKALIESDRHLVLTSPHPSPLSAYQGFFGNNHFKRANNFLIGMGKAPIEWDQPNL